MRFLRNFFILILIAALFGIIGFYIVTDMRQQVEAEYYFRTTLAVETAIARTLFDATRTAEADLPQYRVVEMGDGEPLLDVAARFNTTVEVLRMANRLLPNVDAGFGQEIIVPVGVQELDPPRSLQVYVASDGDNLNSLADRFGVPLDLLQQDNPVLTERGIIPGDQVFIAELL
jgi:LysM repeat protein